MKVIYVDPVTFKCHSRQNEEITLIRYETDFFDNKCDSYIEGYRFVPAGQSWMRSDGVVFHGEMISPWKPYDELDAAQRTYEKEQFAEAKTALEIILGEAS